MSIAGIKKILLTGTALVAVSAFSFQAHAATIDVTTTVSETTSVAESPQAAGDPGVVGDAGYTFTADSTLTTPLKLTLQASATVTGQAGAAGSLSGAVPQQGGAGVYFTPESGVAGASLSLVNNTSITGGTGGNAFSSASAPSSTEAGAVGQAGVITGTGGFTSVTGTGSITGGAGGIGSFGNDDTTGGAGGMGYGGVRVSGSNAVIDDSGLITGGAGGTGGSPTGTAALGGAGGMGGNGINLDSGSAVATVTVTANVTGGAGGNGGTGTDVPNAAVGGVGGNGILTDGSTNTITITGATTTVAGGAAGNSVLGTSTSLAATGAAGGIGLNIDSGTGDIITNAGIIKGGVGSLVAGGSVAEAPGLSGVAVYINTGATVATLTNTGTIGNATTQTSSALFLGGVVTNFSNTGTITNNATTVGNATVVIDANQGANLTNAGTISNVSTSDTAYALDMLSAQTDSIVNASGGKIMAVGSGGNSAPSGTAVHFGNASALTFSNAGTIDGNITDDSINATPTLVNTGTILGNIVFTDTNTKTIMLTSGTVTGVGSSNATIDLSGVAGTNMVSQAGGTVTGTSLGALLFGTGTNSFTQTGGTLEGLADSPTAIAITGGGGATTLTLGGGAIVGVTDLGAGANVINVNGTFSTDGAFLASGGSIALTSETDGVLNVNSAITAGSGLVSVTDNGVINVDTGGSITNSGDLTTSGTGALRVVGGTVTSTGALTNNGSVTINTGSALTAATQTAGTGTFNFQVTGSGTGTMTSGLLTISAVSGGDLNMTGSTFKALVNNTGSNYIATNSVTEVAVSTNGTVASLPNGGTATTAVAINSGSDLYSFSYALGTNATVQTADGAATANEIFLIATRNAIATLAGSLAPNDLSVNSALVAFGNEGVSATPGEILLNTIEGKIATASTAAVIHNDLQALTPTVDGGAQRAALDVGAQIQDVADTRLAALRNGDTTSGVAAGSSVNGVSMWYEGYGQHANQGEMDDVNGYKANTWGSAIGVDSSELMQQDGVIVGVAFNYGYSTISSNNVNTTATDIDNYGLNFYGTFNLDNQMYMNAQAGYAYNSITSDRHNADLAGDTAQGSTHSSQYSTKMLLGRDYAVGSTNLPEGWELSPMTLTPDASAAYTYLNTKAYTESGAAGGADLNVGANSQNVLNLGIGGTVAWKIKDADGSALKPSLHLGYSYDVIGDTIQTASSFVGDPAGNIFTTTGAAPARSIFDVGAKLVYATINDWDFSANYDFQAKEDYTSNTGELRATSHF